MPDTGQLTIVHTITQSPALIDAAGLGPPLASGQVVRYDSAGAPGRNGVRYRIIDIDATPRPGIFVAWADDPLIQPSVSGLSRLHQACEVRPDRVCAVLAGTPFWYGLAQDRTGQQLRVVIGGDPATDGLVPLGQVVATDPGYLERPMPERLRLAGAVARCVAALADLPLVHGAIGTETVLVDPDTGRAAVVGAEYGGVGGLGGTIPARTGDPDGCLAPEQYDAWGVYPETSGQPTDQWALAVVLHHLIFGTHPYFYLPDLAPATVTTALADRGWPDLSTGAPGSYQRWYRQELAALPTPLVELFQDAFADGWATPGFRPAASRWQDELERWSAPPRFDQLAVDAVCVPLGASATVLWRTSHADHVEFIDPDSNAVIPVPTSGSLTLAPAATGPLRMRASGPLGVVEAETPALLLLDLPGFSAAEPPTPVAQPPRPQPAPPAPEVAAPAVGRIRTAPIRAARPASRRFLSPIPPFRPRPRPPRNSRLLRPRREENP